MDLGTKHMRENNKISFCLGLVIHVFIIAAVILYRGGRAVSTAIILPVCIISFIVFVLGYVFWGKEEKAVHPMLISFAVSYMMILIGSIHTPYLYAFGVLIGMDVVIYNKAKTCLLACSTAIIENIIFLIVYYAMGGSSISNSVYMVPTNMAFICLFALVCYMVVKTNGRQNDESLEDIRRSAEEQEKSAAIIRDTSEKISAKLEDADEAMNSLSEKIHSSTEAVDQISSSVSLTAEAIQTQTEMNSNIMTSLENITEESKVMQQLSNVVKGNVDEGNRIINELQSQAKETAEVNNQTQAMTDELAKSAETVKEIVSAILTISSQTNLLALNASIEAARAGEAGRGFAVVADEIRKLSEDTKSSAEQIVSTIETLIENVHNASDNMQKTVEYSNKQGELIGETGEKFEKILESVNSLTDNVDQISGNVETCAKATEKVMESVTDLSATSEEVAASSESSLGLSIECEKDMEKTNEILAEILKLSRHE